MPRVRTVEGSCWACKERRVICDLSQPTCGKCANAGRVCDYGKVRLKWTDCVASRGRLAGQKIPLCRPPTIRKNSDHHLLYFEHELLPRFNISNTIPRVNLASLARDPLLLQSIVAVGTAHQTYRNTSVGAESSLTKSQDRKHAIRMFRKNLSGSHSEEVNTSLFLANVLLCMLDGMIEQQNNDDSAAHHHIVGGKAILGQWGGVSSILKTKFELPIFMLSIFATMDLTHSLLIGEQPFLQASLWAEFGNCEPWWGNVKPDDNFLETMAIFAQLATLGHGVRYLKKTVPIGVLLSIQMALEQQSTHGTDVKQDDPEVIGWSFFCSVYRLAASIYLYRALSGLSVDHPLVQQATTACMEVIAGTNLTANLHHCILFPLLIVGSHCMLDEQRQLIRRSISHSATYLSFGSLRSLVIFLEGQWGKVDKDPKYLESSWWTYYDEIANVTCLF